VSTTTLPNNERDQDHLCRNRDAEEVDEADVLVPNNFDLVNQTEPAEVIPQLLFSGVLIQTTEIYISACIALLNRQCDLAGNWGRLPPTDLQLLSM
jgi:hypothetical protein